MKCDKQTSGVGNYLKYRRIKKLGKMSEYDNKAILNNKKGGRNVVTK